MRRRLQTATVVLCLTMLAGACGGDDDKDEPPSTVATTSATIAPVRTTLPGNALPRLPEVFAPIPGYAFGNLEAKVLTDLEDEIASDQDTKLAVVAADGRSATREGDPDEAAVVIIAVKFDEESAAQPGVEAAFIAGATKDAVTTRQLTLSEEEATLGTDADGTITVAWLKGTLSLLIIGNDEAVILPVATALIAANK